MPASPLPSAVLLEIDLGDDELMIRQFADGMVTLEHGEPRLLLNAEQWQQVLDGFVRLSAQSLAIALVEPVLER